jgi:hypothetical protein
MMLCVDLSSDAVRLITAEESVILPPQSIEHEFGIELLRLIGYNSHSDGKSEGSHSPVAVHPPWRSIMVIIGPGSFTTLRVWCFLLNQLNLVSKNRYPLYGVTKLQLFEAAYRAGILWPRGYMYIGQARNVRSIDFETAQKPIKISQESLQLLAHDHPDQYSSFRQETTHHHWLWSDKIINWTDGVTMPDSIAYVRYGYSHHGVLVQSALWDIVYTPDSHQMLARSSADVSTGSRADLASGDLVDGREPVYHLEPWYGIEPTVGS